MVMINLSSLRQSVNVRFWLTLVIQAALILAVPAQAALTQLTGKTVVLQTAPVDPYNPFQGYYVTLNYEVSDPNRLKMLQGWQAIEQRASQAQRTGAIEPNQAAPLWTVPETTFYVILQAPVASVSQPPQPWQPVAIAPQYPFGLPANQVALQGLYRNGQIQYGLETYYIPEEERQAIDDQINQLRRTDAVPRFVVEVKVGSSGKAVPSGFWLGDRRYEF